ncbi:hypothetical protein A0H81_10916 [Grifola frondosa]|uniref:Uncharacterized protein n=1 Tax=Grifola frondosa TaxID=5627 RepID=A0A1C7LWT1_GRIFR|nr:hypothetical protein A0H81_10916 [Grifola frondosa]
MTRLKPSHHFKEWSKTQVDVVKFLLKERNQLRKAVSRCEERQRREERLRVELLARDRLNRLVRKVDQSGLLPTHIRELREILQCLPEAEAAPLHEKLRQYETRRLLKVHDLNSNVDTL